MINNLVNKLLLGLVMLLVLLLCFVTSWAVIGVKDKLYLSGDIDYLWGKYPEALTQYEQALNFGCPSNEGPCITRDNSESKFFCAPFRASARLYVMKRSATTQTVLHNYWKGLTGKFPNELDKCLKDAEENPPWNKMDDEERRILRDEIKVPPSPSPQIKVATPSPIPTYTPRPTSTYTLMPTILPTTTRFLSRPCASSGYRPYEDPILLHPKVDRGSSTTIPRVFGTNQVIINWPSNKNTIACLASSPDGLGMLSVDDQIEIRITRGSDEKKWILNFYDPATGGIGQQTAQDITWMFSSGANLVNISLYDTNMSYYYAEPVWLVMWQSP